MKRKTSSIFDSSPQNEKIKLRPRVKALLDLALSLHHATSTDQILSELAQQVSEYFGAECVRLFAYNTIDNEVHTRVKLSDTFEEIKFSLSEDSIAGYTALHKKVIKLDDVRNFLSVAHEYPGLRYDSRYENSTGVKIHSIISIPILTHKSDLIGVIQLINMSVSVISYSAVDIDLLVHIGKLVAMAVFNHDERQKRSTKFDLLLEESVISENEVNEAIELARKNEDDIVEILLDKYGIGSKAMQASISRFYLTDFLPFDENLLIPTQLLKGLNSNYCRKNLILPIDFSDDRLTLWLSNPNDSVLVKEVKKSFMAKKSKLYVGFNRDILMAIDLAFGSTKRNALKSEEARKPMPSKPSLLPSKDTTYIVNESAPLVVRVLNKILLDAFQEGASDIHIEPGAGDDDTVVRFRKDGICFKHSTIPVGIADSTISRAKIMAGLKIEEHRFPQSGKIQIKHGASTIEFRVETTPTIGRNEDVVMRLLAGTKLKHLKELDMYESTYNALSSMIKKPFGTLLVVGPTGSGKTTTLHGILHELNSGEKKIWTVEDPVEITQSGLRQVQVNYNIKPKPFDFSSAMRSFLRADPDVIMVGEMRDKETAKIAIEASLTGHLVLSTLHTNSASKTIARLLSMGIDTFNVADSLLGVIAQRLVRVLCGSCKEKYTPTPTEIKEIKESMSESEALLSSLSREAINLFNSVGCDQCNNTGFKGRVGVYELLSVTDTLKDHILAKNSVSSIRKTAIAEGMLTLKMDGFRRVLSGQTTFEEIKRVCMD